MKVLRWIAIIVLLAAVALAVAYARRAAPPPPAESESARRLAAGPHAVAKVDTAFIDGARPTPPNGDFGGARARTLEATVWAPRDVATPHPLVVYSHGFMSNRSENAPLAELLASHGYVVVAVDFPLTNGAAPGGATVTDVAEQPGDVRFVIDQILAWRGGDRPFAGEIDTDRIAAVGLSLGGLTTELVSFHPRLRDPRIAAAVSIAGPSEMFSSDFFATTDVPMLMIGGTGDAMIPFERNAAPIPEKIREGGLVAIEGGSHAGFAYFADLFPLRLLSNPDALGCWALTANLGGEDDEPPANPLAGLGGPEDGILDVDPEAAMPCRDGAPDEALSAGRQQMITRLAAFAFLQGRFARDAQAREAHARYLRETLAQDFPEARFTPARG